MRSILVVLCLTVLLPSTTLGQVNDDVRTRRRAFIQNLLEGLIDSTGNPETHDEHAGHDHSQNTDGRVPVRASNEMLHVRHTLKEFADSTHRLVQGLSEEQAYSSSIRLLLSDVMKVHSAGDVLFHRAGRTPGIQFVKNDFQALDRDWRILAHKISETPGISDRSLDIVDEIQQYDDELCIALGVSPQLDRNKLVRLSSSLNTSYEHLVQDIYYDLPESREKQNLLSEGRRLYTAIRNATALIDRGNYDAIVNAYRICQNDWKKYALRLSSIQTERIRRDIIDIEQIGAAIHEQLWLPKETNSEHVMYLVQGIMQDTESLFSAITLQDILKCEQPGAVFNSARIFNNSTNAFAASLRSSQNQSEWVWKLEKLQTDWNSLRQQCVPFQSPMVRGKLNGIVDAMAQLQHVLGKGPALTRRELVQMAGELDHLTLEIQRLVNNRLIAGNHRYDRNFARQLQLAATDLHTSVHHLRDSLANGGRDNQINQQLQQMFGQWSALKQFANQLDARGRQEVNVYRRQIEPIMVKLQVVFEN